MLARSLIKPFGNKSENVLLGFLLITGVFSMFVSNTATAAMAMRNIVCQSGLRPERISSANILVNIGTAMATHAESKPKANVIQNALDAPFR